MSCLTDYIGLRGCGDIAPESGLYLDQLPGITIEGMDKIATSEQTTYKNVWRDVQDTAYKIFEREFFAALLNCYSINKKCDYTALLCNNKEIQSVAWQYLLASTLMWYRRYTTRLNFFTTVALDDAESLMQKYKDEYKSALKAAITMVDVSSCHLHCGGDPEVVTWLP